MMERYRVFHVAVCVVLILVSYSAKSDSEPSLEIRIANVINGLHVLKSPGSVPDKKWTLQERMEHLHVPAVSIAVIHDGRIEWARAYGFVSAGERRPVTNQTRFQAASVSKALTAFATLRVVDEGLLDLGTPVNRYLRNWKLQDSDAGLSDSVTIALLMAHMAGLNWFVFPGYAPDDSIPTLIQILDGAPPANSKPVRITQTPGSSWSYSNGGYMVLQQVLEDITGENFSTLMDQLILAPLGMEHSTFEQPLPSDLESLASVGHHDDGTTLPERWRTQPELAAAGLWTTASDLARFALGVYAAANQSPDALLSAESAVALTTQRFINFSLGLLIRRNGGHRWFTHNGGNEGYRCLMYSYLTVGEGAVVMANSDNGLMIASEIINSIALEYEWPRFIPEVFW